MRPILALLLICACTPVEAPDEPPDEPTPPPVEAPAHLLPLIAACETAPTLPEGTGYDGLISDSHVHMTVDDDPLDYALALLDEMNASGVDRVVVQADHFLSHANAATLDEDWAEFVTWCPRLLWLVGGFDPEDEGSVPYVLARLDEAPVAGIGELNIEHGAGITVDPDSPALQTLYGELEERGLSVHLQAVNTGTPNWLAMEAQAEAHPDLGIAWFGCSGLFFDEGSLPNVGCTLFPMTPTGMPTDSATLERHVGRGILGTDSAPTGFTNPAAQGLPYDDLAGGIAAARAYLGALNVSEEAREGFARGNFDRIWADRR